MAGNIIESHIKETNEEICYGKLRGLIRNAKVNFKYGTDYRDPEPPPLDETRLKQIFFPKNLTEDVCIESNQSLKVLPSRTDVKDGISAVTKGIYDSVRSVQEAIRRRDILLQSIPILTTRELNKLTMPPSKYLIIELEEDGYHFSSYILKKFMDEDDKIIELYEKREFKKLERKPLRDNRYYLIVLSEALKLVEEYKKYSRKTDIYSLFMYLGEFFRGLHNSWLWLAYEMYTLATDTIQGYRVDLGYGEALARYVLGKFCYKQMDDPEEALEHFEIAHKLSYKRKWNTEPLGGSSEEEIHTSSMYMEHEAALALAHRIIHTDPKRATELGFKALKRITETGKHPEIEEAMRSLAYLYEQSKQPEISLTILKKQMKQSFEVEDYRGMILGYYLKAHCYKVMKKYDNACSCLQEMITLAKKYDEKDLEALGCKCLGEYFFNTGNLELADELLSRAVTKFLEVGQIAEAGRVSIHAGAVKAARHMPLYTKLIISSETQRQVNQIIKWQMTEDLDVLNKLAHRMEDDDKRKSILSSDKSKNTGNFTKLALPDHERVKNSMLYRTEIHIMKGDEISDDSD